MITLSNGKDHVDQWDTGVRIITDVECTDAVFWRPQEAAVATVHAHPEGDTYVARIPDRMMADYGYIEVRCILAAAEGDGTTVDTARIRVAEAGKPENYAPDDLKRPEINRLYSLVQDLKIRIENAENYRRGTLPTMMPGAASWSDLGGYYPGLYFRFSSESGGVQNYSAAREYPIERFPYDEVYTAVLHGFNGGIEVFTKTGTIRKSDVAPYTVVISFGDTTGLGLTHSLEGNVVGMYQTAGGADPIPKCDTYWMETAIFDAEGLINKIPEEYLPEIPVPTPESEEADETGIDDAVTEGSENLITSGAVAEWINPVSKTAAMTQDVGRGADGKLYTKPGSKDHTQLTNRDAANQHPMGAVTGLSAFAKYMDYIYYGASVPFNTVVCNSAGVAPGTKICYKLTAQTGKSGYLDVLNTSGTRITYLGKGSSGTATNDYEGEYTLPDNFGKIVVGGTGPLTPLYVTTDERYQKIKEYAREYRLEQNVFDVNRIQTGVRGIPIKPGVEYAEGWWLTEFFPVEQGDEITVNWFITTPYYGHMYYDDQKNAVGGVLMTQANTTFTIPSGVSYVRLAGNSTVDTSSARVTVKHLHAYLFRQNAERKHSEYERVILHPFGGFTDGKPYAAFPTLCFFGGKLVAAYRSSKTHLVPSSQDDWGGISVFSMTPDGFWKHEAFITGEGLGITGELRDPHLAVSPDGKHLYLSGPSTYTVSGVEHHDNYIIEIGTDFTVLGCYYEHDVEKLLRGPCLFTPNGNILYTAFSLSTGVGVYRSDAPFDGDLTALSFTEAADFHVAGQQFDEGAIGYVNGSLYVIFRNEGGTRESYISHTADPEGLTGWTTPASVGLKLHAPELLPTNAGDKFVFAGAYFDHYTSDQDRLRYPVIGLIDTTTDTVVCWGAVDDSVIGYSGYCGIVPFGGNEYGIIYYEDRGGTAVYYKRINLGYICPETAYLVPNRVGGDA